MLVIVFATAMMLAMVISTGMAIHHEITTRPREARLRRPAGFGVMRNYD